MRAIDIPTKVPEPFGKNAAGAFIRSIPITTTTPGAASFDQGFPQITAIPVAAGGIPPNIADVNGIMFQVTAWAQWQAAGGNLPPWDSAFSTLIGGYPSGAVVQSATIFGNFWVCMADNNTTNPDTGGANWTMGSLFGSSTTGDFKLSFKTTTDFGWIPTNDGSIGNGSSNATTLASALTLPLFSLLYGIPDAFAPLQTSVGGATTRAAQGTAAAAYAANCRLVLPKMLGRALAVAGAGAGLTARALGSIFGEENHVLIPAELAVHAHSAFINDPGHFHNVTAVPNNPGLAAGGPTQFAGGSAAVINTTANTTQVRVWDGATLDITAVAGSNSPHNTMQPTSFLNGFVHL